MLELTCLQVLLHDSLCLAVTVQFAVQNREILNISYVKRCVRTRRRMSPWYINRCKWNTRYLLHKKMHIHASHYNSSALCQAIWGTCLCWLYKLINLKHWNVKGRSWRQSLKAAKIFIVKQISTSVHHIVHFNLPSVNLSFSVSCPYSQYSCQRLSSIAISSHLCSDIGGRRASVSQI